MLLTTLGHPALYRSDRTLVGGLRRKDLALLVYLCVEGLPVHARGRLATLLWGESDEARARHSLTQALGRLVKALGPGILVPDKDAVRWSGALPCDAVALLRDVVEPEEVDDAFSLYAGDFLQGFDLGRGAEDFGDWADRRRAEIRNAALRLLERAGEQAEAAGAWERALRLGERGVEINPLWEQGRRRILRALAARGERNSALQYYQEFTEWLTDEMGVEPDRDTRALAEQLRAWLPPRPRAPTPVLPAVPAGEPDAPDPPAPAADPPPLPPAAAAPHPAQPGNPPGAGVEATGDAVPAIPPAPAPDGGLRDEVAAARRADRHTLTVWLVMALAGALLALTITIARERAAEEHTDHPPVDGESVRVRGTDRIFLAFGGTLYEYPDSYTLCVCTGWYPEVVRVIRALPPWRRRVLPSVMDQPWIGGSLPVVSDHPEDRTGYVPVGCINARVPTRETLDSIFGSGAVDRMQRVPHSVLARLPRATIARGHPLRPAGTLIRGPDDRVRWITYHGGALEVDPGVLASHCRSPKEAVEVSQREFDYYGAWGTLARGDGDCP